jgi:hypothetical protein
MESEFGGVDLGDTRLNRRCQLLAATLGAQSQSSIPAACGSWAETKAAYRFFDNPSVTMDSIMSPHQEASRERIAKEKVVILAQDTTELDFTHTRVESHLGTLSWDTRFGWLVHLSLALTPDRVCLGVVEAKVWTRDPNDPSKNCRRKKKPITEKESLRWIEGYKRACAIADGAPETKVVSVSDREGDIYELFLEAAGGTADWVVRSCQTRRMSEKEPGKSRNYKKLLDHVAQQDVVGEVSFGLPGRGGRSARRVHQKVKAATVELHPPYRKGTRLPPVTINAVLLREEESPDGVEPLEWLLLTSLPIENWPDIEFVVECYLCRWQIECFFKILKSGCRVERLQMETPDRILPCLGLYLIIAWRILHLTMLGRACPDLPCTLVFGDAEWKAVTVVESRKPPPDIPPSLGDMIKCIARQGSYVGRRGDNHPGMVSIWTGLQRVMDYARAWEAFGPEAHTYG